MESKNTSAPIAIIGAGLSGLSLALALSKHSISSAVFETRDPSNKTDGALMLSPNSLRILDRLGVYKDLVGQGYEFENVTFQDRSRNTLWHNDLGGTQWGYRALRVYREALLQGLRKEVAATPLVQIQYGKKFARIVSEEEGKVVFEFSDGTQHEAPLLIGCDGIHSTVRRTAIVDVKAKYIGLMAVTGTIATKDLEWDQPASKDPQKPYPMPLGVNEDAGAFIVAPQNPEGSECLAGTQIAFPDRSRAEWDALIADKAGIKKLLTSNLDKWSPFVQSAINAIPEESMFIWPFNTMPRLDTWTSKAGRVVIIGDAAHAVPPTAGQGASQSMEDAFTLAQLLHLQLAHQTSLDNLSDFAQNLKKWQDYRQARIDKVLQLTQKLNVRREPGWKPVEGEDLEVNQEWLFNVNPEEEIVALLQS